MSRISSALHRLRTGDCGSSVVEFAMVSVLLVVLFFAVLQVAVYVYARSVIAASAADGARLAADRGVDPGRGAERAALLVRSGLGRAAANRIACTADPSVDGPSSLSTVTVRCRGELRALLPFRVALVVDVSGSALKEQSP